MDLQKTKAQTRRGDGDDKGLPLTMDTCSSRFTCLPQKKVFKSLCSRSSQVFRFISLQPDDATAKLKVSVKKLLYLKKGVQLHIIIETNTHYYFIKCFIFLSSLVGVDAVRTCLPCFTIKFGRRPNLTQSVKCNTFA